MSDKKKLVAFIVVLVIVSVVGIYFYKTAPQPKGTTTTTDSVKNGGLGSSLGGILAIFGI